MGIPINQPVMECNVRVLLPLLDREIYPPSVWFDWLDGWTAFSSKVIRSASAKSVDDGDGLQSVVASAVEGTNNRIISTTVEQFFLFSTLL